MTGPLMRDVSQKRMRRLAAWILPLVGAVLLAAGNQAWWV